MTLLLGNLTLSAAVLVAIGTFLLSLRAARSSSQAVSRAARGGLLVLAALLTIASADLLIAMLSSDFRLEYVAHYTERTLPPGYKAAAFWAGQQGSLLLWAWILSAMGAGFVFSRRTENGAETVVAAGVLAAVIGFFAALMLFAANPFSPAEEMLADGQGLNPMLQDPGMIAHPPVLFTGYAGFTVPFALLIGALATGRLGEDWVKSARPWVLISWLFLGGGILLGANWAYTVLGWGGYWAWDPVENASLLPWLTGTALLHDILNGRNRGTFKRWTATLTAGTFLLCVFGTWITRSGVVDSVHTFGHSLVGTFFGVFLTVATLGTAALIVLRWRELRPQQPIENLLSREGAFLGANLVLVAMMFITLIGTLFPALTRAIGDEPMSVKASFYNRGVLPLALVLLALMTIAPILSYGRDTMKRLVRSLGVPLIAAAIAVGVLWVADVRSVWALASAVLCTVLVATIAIDVIRSVRARQHNTNENAFAAALHLLDANHRRYGGHIVHAGIVMIVAGITGSSLYGTKQMVQLRPGDSVNIGNYALRLDSINEVREANYTAVEAAIGVTGTGGAIDTLRPQRRFYDKAEEASTQVALRSNWKEDLYVTVAGWEEGGRVTTFQVIVNPMVRWIWAGGILLTLGGIWCLVPRFSGVRQSQTVVESKAIPVRRNTKKSRRDRAALAAH
jgi:cytochrome c-type biogenesis protein CcmF